MRVSLWAAVSRYTRRNTVNCVTMSTFHCLRTNLLQLTERAVLTAMRTNDDGGGTLLQFFNMYINRSNKMIFLRFCRNISPSNTHPWLLHCIYFIPIFPININSNRIAEWTILCINFSKTIRKNWNIYFYSFANFKYRYIIISRPNL